MSIVYVGGILGMVAIGFIFKLLHLVYMKEENQRELDGEMAIERERQNQEAAAIRDSFYRFSNIAERRERENLENIRVHQPMAPSAPESRIENLSSENLLIISPSSSSISHSSFHQPRGTEDLPPSYDDCVQNFK